MLFSFVAPVATTYIILRYQKKLVKREVKRKIIAGIDKSELVLLKFTDEEKQSQLKWKHSKEFQYKGEMYDIVEKEIRGDTTYYWCWWDHEETKLNKQLMGLVSRALGNNPKNQENQKRFYKFFSSLFYAESTKNGYIAYKEVNNETCFKQRFHQILFYSPSVPPPEII